MYLFVYLCVYLMHFVLAQEMVPVPPLSDPDLTHQIMEKYDGMSQGVQHLPLSSVGDVSLVVAMICRDEQVNFESNLALWLEVADYFIFIMDTRNTDDSEQVIARILSGTTTNNDNSNTTPQKSAKGYQIVKNEFIGFGQARTLSLAKSWEYFGKNGKALLTPTSKAATHVLIADPDWRPSTMTMKLNEVRGKNS